VRSDTSSVFEPEHGPTGHEPNINELGIIIGRKLLELMGGEVVIENGVPRGLQATIRIPARPAKPEHGFREK
jgi:signal transduction histidine kinase